MPIQVAGPDGQLYEFPDGTSRETMRAAMAKRYAAPKADFSNVQSRADTVEQQQPIDPTEGMSGFDKAMAGIGLSLAETGRGVRQFIGDALHSGTDLFGKIAGQDPAAERRAQV